MKVTYFYGNRWWARAHRAGCRDIGPEVRKDPNASAVTVEASTLRELVEDVAGDFIFLNDHEPWEMYADQISLAPCLTLPRE